jgi:hypothetical protein
LIKREKVRGTSPREDSIFTDSIAKRNPGKYSLAK